MVGVFVSSCLGLVYAIAFLLNSSILSGVYSPAPPDNAGVAVDTTCGSSLIRC